MANQSDINENIALHLYIFFTGLQGSFTWRFLFWNLEQCCDADQANIMITPL